MKTIALVLSVVGVVLMFTWHILGGLVVVAVGLWFGFVALGQAQDEFEYGPVGGHDGRWDVGHGGVSPSGQSEGARCGGGDVVGGSGCGGGSGSDSGGSDCGGGSSCGGGGGCGGGGE
ncbi:hypothetical protein ACWEKT_08870 [Nocardia takedensis]